MISHESQRNIWEWVRTHCRQPPELVYYDNACNLQEFVLSRDPASAMGTQFMCGAAYQPGAAAVTPFLNLHPLQHRRVPWSGALVRQLPTLNPARRAGCPDVRCGDLPPLPRPLRGGNDAVQP
jgi:hypothetical protein